jgi:hypothetical protein
MRVAVLCTGKLRTFQETHALIRQNLLDPWRADVFMFLNETPEAIAAAEVLERWPNVKKIQTQGNDSDYVPIQQLILNKLDRWLAPNDKWVLQYLSWGGSLLAYYQLYKCMQMMLAYERAANVEYDVVVRTRCDVLLLRPMRSVEVLFSNAFDNLQSYLLQKPPIAGPVPQVYTARKDCLWIARRSEALLLSNMIFHYGTFRPHTSNWWNSETQFQSFMHWYGIRFADYYDELLDQYMRSRSKNRSVIQHGVLNPVVPAELIFTCHRPLDYDQFSEA